MAASNNGQNQEMSLSATYSSPTNQSFGFTEQLGPAPSAKVAVKTKYLSDLRTATGYLQDKINKELTERMEEDKARGAEIKNGNTKVDDAKEEENYGEEVVEEDD